MINKKDKSKYLDELNISEVSLKNALGKKKKKVDKEIMNYKKPSFYVNLSNRYFLKKSTELIQQGYFKKLRSSLQRGNFVFLVGSYVSMMFLTTVLALFVGVFLALFFLFVGISFSDFSVYFVSASDIPMRLLKVFWFIPLTPLITYLVLLYYPSMEEASLETKLNNELPFVALQMAAIAGANIEPSNIFRIISMSKEYPTLRREAMKLMNQINLYGYDLVNALKNVAETTPSKKWADLLNGMSTSIKLGGSLASFLNKRAETLIFEYQIEREKATRIAETYMNIYISVVIAAPMLILLLLIMMSVSGIGFPLSIGMITLIMVLSVSIINVLFLLYLNLKQKKI